MSKTGTCYYLTSSAERLELQLCMAVYDWLAIMIKQCIYHSDDVTVYYAQVVYSVYTPGYTTPSSL